MSFSLLKILKGLLISEENTLTPKEIEIVPGGTANTKTTVVSSQTTNVTVTLPNASDTLATETQVETVQTNLDNHINDAEGAHAASAISNTPADGLDAVTVQGALDELNQDIIGFSGDLETHTEATVAHGTTSDIVGKDDAQTLTNKTISGSNNTLSDIASTSTTFASETALSVGTSNDDTNINIGTGTGANTINIGGANSQINLVGSVISQDVENLNVKDKLITLNDGGAAGSGAVSGIEIEEGGSPTGYVKTSADRNSWELKSPNAAGIVSVTPGASNDAVTLNAAEQTLTNKTVGDAVTFDGQASTPSTPSAGFYKVYVKDSSGKLTILDSAGTETIIGAEGYQAIAGEAISANDALYIAGTSDTGRTVGRVYKLDPTDNNRMEFAGFAKANANLGDSFIVLATGELTGFSGLSVGQPVFASVTVPGGVQTTVPAVIGQYIIQVGIAKTASSLLINGALSSTATLVESPDMNIGAAQGSSLVLNGTLANSAILQADSTSKGFLAPRMNQTERDAIVSPATGLQIYNTSSNKLNVYNGTSWTDVGSGSGGGSKNYIPNPDFEAGATTNWIRGTVALGSNKFPNGTPTFGSGFSANLAIDTVTSGSQLSGTYSMSYASSTATVAGNFVASSAFTIDKEDQAKALSFSFSYQAAVNPTSANWSGTTSNSFGVAIYDVTNSQWIQPAGCFSMVQSSGVGKASGTFQTSANGTQYRLVVYNANATSGAITVYMDSFTFGPQITNMGVPVTDWVSYTPTGSWTSNTTYSGKWRRVGDTMEGQIVVSLSGTPNATSLTVNLPSGYSIDTNKISPSTENKNIGRTSILDSGTVNYQGYVGYAGTTQLLLGVWPNATYTSSVGINSTTPIATLAAGDTIWATFSVPIAGWSSNTVMSSDAAVNVVAARAVVASPTTIATSINVKVPLVSATLDTANIFNSANNRFINPVAGPIRVTAQLTYDVTSAGAYWARIYKNGVEVETTFQNISSYTGSNYSTIYIEFLDLSKATDYYEIYAYQTTGSNKSLVNCKATFERISGPTQIAAASVVTASFSGTKSSTTTLDQVVLTKIVDSTGSTSGNTWIVPISGYYEIEAFATIGTGNGTINDRSLYIYVDGSSNFATAHSHAYFGQISAGTIVSLNAGQIISFYCQSATIAGSLQYFRGTIKRLGGVM